jgi:glycosyltransferase involved in cell wall biosynthesis
MKVVFLNNPRKPLTGGHKYNNALLSYLKNHYQIEVRTAASCAESYQSWRKVYAPLAELKWIKIIGHDDIIFFGDTSYKYHLLLLIFIRLLRKGTPMVIIHHFPYLIDRGVRKCVNFLWQHIYYRLCRSIIVPSPYTLNHAKRLFPQKAISYIPIPFDSRFNVSGEYVTGNLLFVGSVEKRKGLHYLLESLVEVRKTVPHVHLDIVGTMTDVKYYNRLAEYVKSHQLDDIVCFRGRVSEQEKEDLFKHAEMFVSPSLLEGYGMVFVEAMNYGLPIVAFDNSAIPYTIKDGVNGLLAVNKDAASFARKITMLTGNLNYRKHLQGGMKDTISHIATKRDFEEGIRHTFDEIIFSS